MFGNKIVDKGFIFSSMKGEPNRIRTEEALQKNCNVLTTGKRCADWFLMKMMATGTMAGKFIQLFIIQMIRSCMTSRKGYFRSAWIVSLSGSSLTMI